MTKVVTFGAFVEILPGVEGLVHISELAQHHVENPREVVAQGQPVNVKIIEVDGERRRLSLSLKRVEDTDPVQPRADGAESVHTHRGRRSTSPRKCSPRRPSWRRRGRARVVVRAFHCCRRGSAPPAEAVAARRRRGQPKRQRSKRQRSKTQPVAEAPDESRGRRRREPKTPRSRLPTRQTPLPRRAGSVRLRRVSRPVAVAITGGIGAGKSEALAAFARHGAATVSSDEIVHHLLRRDDVKAALVGRLGNGIVAPDGEIDRGALGTVVFNDPEALQWLEALLHPLVSAEYLQWREDLAALPDAPRVTVTEVPLLYETGGDERFDKVVVITAPTKLRRARSDVAIDDREGRFLPDREKVKRADCSFKNIGSLEELDAFVKSVMAELTAE